MSKSDFSNEPIKIVPHISVPTPAASPGLPAGTAPGIMEDDADLNVPEGDLTEKDCIELTMICVNIPSMFGNPHLERSEAQCNPFGRQLHRYCIKNHIDPADYVFAEFGLLVTGIGLVGGMWADHKVFKAANRKPKQTDAGTGVAEVVGQPPEPPETIPDARPQGAKLSTMTSGGDET